MAFYSDINLELNKDQSGDVKKDEDLDAVKNSIRNICETIQNQRVMLPTFAENGFNILFEPVNEEYANMMGEIIWDSIKDWDSRVGLENININVDYTNQQYQIEISFSVKNISLNLDPEIFSIIINRISRSA